jgi:hypothetical protein
MTATCSRTQALAKRLTIGLRAGSERDVYYSGLPLRTAWQWSRRIYWLMSSDDGVPTKWRIPLGRFGPATCRQNASVGQMAFRNEDTASQ